MQSFIPSVVYRWSGWGSCCSGMVLLKFVRDCACGGMGCSRSDWRMCCWSCLRLGAGSKLVCAFVD
ncbi:hypothetical protein KC19_5G196700 [Ceratodon purpureus]|uniref:Uncharacterized protein n=1 Tax=Ceratodon purpureus TaxID=3225 RepID=A0A8T0I4Z1_CERPU|nr:hypothetical protein KC19_5G196700 [Ceratodon purpureus]